MQEDYGKKLLIESVVDFNTGDQHYDASWHGNLASVTLDLRFHYEGQKRTRKLLAMIVCIQEKDESESHQACAATFDDIREAIRRNTAQFYTRGIQTPTAFYEFWLTVPRLEAKG